MRLQKPFCRLPVRFDVQRLCTEIEGAPASAWSDHPDDYPGNKALRLITAGGTENDDVAGEMRTTSHLVHFPYLQQVLASFGVVWSRSRLMKLGARGSVPLHCDVNYHWHHRVRVHIPIVTHPGVRFSCAGETVHMAAGEAWIFDNWRQHSVQNDSDHDRIHLVADTMGNDRFWQFASRGQTMHFMPLDAARDALLPYKPGVDLPLLMERFNSAIVMPPAELESLVGMLCGDMALKTDSAEGQAETERLVMQLKSFCSEWRQLWSMFSDQTAGWLHYAALRKTLRAHLLEVKVPIYLRSNGALFIDALQQGVTRHVMNIPASMVGQMTAAGHDPVDAPAATRRVRLTRPIFIVAAPRSGSTLLFETLAQSCGLYTLGGEAHYLVEQFAGLRPGEGGVDSNRLTAANLTPDMSLALNAMIASQLRGADGRAPAGDEPVRLLEKTPKNALRIPFFSALFPDALFVYLWRDPQENLSSIMEAWRSGSFVTYPASEGWEQPWSLLLPPGWQQLRTRPLEEIAAFQWRSTNEIILQDLTLLPAENWTTLRYSDLLAQPEREVRRLCEFAGLQFDEPLRARVAAPLPLSRHTLTAPKAVKWRKNEAEIMRVLPPLEPVVAQLLALGKRAF